MARIKDFFKKETILIISAAAALVTMYFIPPSQDYFSYIDFRVLALLFCLMAAVGGLQKTGAFSILAERLTSLANGTRTLCLCLVLICFFSAMLITNDVALLTFVPFAILVLNLAGQKRLIIFTVIMQTVAANLGSMLTPVGNPQNIYLFFFYKMSVKGFFSITAGITAAALFIIIIVMLFVKNEKIRYEMKQAGKISSTKNFICYILIFALSLGTVLHIIPYQATFILTIAAVFISDRKLFKDIDYGLLATFIFFFIFVGNLKYIPQVQSLITRMIDGNEFFSSLILSQIISNVPAAVFLSGFTDKYAELLLGVNIGGLGTLIASLASLISFKIYIKSQNAVPLKYLAMFTAANTIILIPLAFLSYVILK